jgi:UDP-galactopyranose mutase
MMQKMIGDIPIRLNTDYFFNRDYFDSCAKQIVYTGCIDQFFNYEYGKLEYRSLKFKHQILDQENYQGVAVKNYCDHSTNYTRIIEHKHFEKINTNKTVITKEYPQKCENNLIPYYPINDEKNDQIYKKYQEKSRSLTSVIFGGRLSQYKYMNMDDTIKSAMNMFKQQFC